MLPGKLEGGNFISLIRKWQTMWNNTVLEHLQSMRLTAGPGIRLQRMPGGTVISAERGRGTGGMGGAAPDPEGGPFAVTAEAESGRGKTSWVIRLHNSTGSSGKAGMVTAGSYRKLIHDQEWKARAGTVYLDVTYSDNTESYTVVFALESEVPDTGDEKRYILRIAEVAHDPETNVYTVSQVRPYGDIEIAGRWVK